MILIVLCTVCKLKQAEMRCVSTRCLFTSSEYYTNQSNNTADHKRHAVSVTPSDVSWQPFATRWLIVGWGSLVNETNELNMFDTCFITSFITLHDLNTTTLTDFYLNSSYYYYILAQLSLPCYCIPYVLPQGRLPPIAPHTIFSISVIIQYTIYIYIYMFTVSVDY